MGVQLLSVYIFLPSSAADCPPMSRVLACWAGWSIQIVAAWMNSFALFSFTVKFTHPITHLSINITINSMPTRERWPITDMHWYKNVVSQNLFEKLKRAIGTLLLLPGAGRVEHTDKVALLWTAPDNEIHNIWYIWDWQQGWTCVVFCLVKPPKDNVFLPRLLKDSVSPSEVKMVSLLAWDDATHAHQVHTRRLLSPEKYKHVKKHVKAIMVNSSRHHTQRSCPSSAYNHLSPQPPSRFPQQPLVPPTLPKMWKI